MTPGQVKETVEVTAELPMVETTGNTIGGTIEAERAEQLPLNGRDFLKLMTLVPGSNADPSSVNDAPGSFGIFSINGNRGRSNNYLLDGTDMNDGYRNDPAINEAGVFGTPATILPVDALAEVAILSNMEAEYGRNSGGTVNIVTKSGTNNIHGSSLRILPQRRARCAQLFQRRPQPQEQLSQQPVRRIARRADGEGQDVLVLWLYEGQRESRRIAQHRNCADPGAGL